MKNKLLLLITITFTVVLIFSSCQFQIPLPVTPTSITPKLISKKPHIRGIIQDIVKKDGKVISIFIAGKIDPDTIYDKAYVGITDKTVIYLKINSDYKVINPDDLKVGDNAAALFVGPVGQSYPVQAAADEIVVNP